MFSSGHALALVIVRCAFAVRREMERQAEVFHINRIHNTFHTSLTQFCDNIVYL